MSTFFMVTYINKNNGAVVGSHLRPIFPAIVMVELEMRIIPTVTVRISHWRSCVDYKFVFIKKDCVAHVLALLNSFYRNTQYMN